MNSFLLNSSYCGSFKSFASALCTYFSFSIWVQQFFADFRVFPINIICCNYVISQVAFGLFLFLINIVFNILRRCGFSFLKVLEQLSFGGIITLRKYTTSEIMGTTVLMMFISNFKAIKISTYRLIRKKLRNPWRALKFNITMYL